MDEHGMFYDFWNTVRVDSRYVAEKLEMNHSDVVSGIRTLISNAYGLSGDFRLRSFSQSKYTDAQGRDMYCYQMTRDGFAMLARILTGKRVAGVKAFYIKRFNDMEKKMYTNKASGSRTQCTRL